MSNKFQVDARNISSLNHSRNQISAVEIKLTNFDGDHWSFKKVLQELTREVKLISTDPPTIAMTWVTENLHGLIVLMLLKK